MKVKIFNHDMMIKSKDGIEIDSFPKNVGIEHMRWTGEELIDLLDLDSIWCEYINSSFRLHAIQVPYSQHIQMQYKDRKKLWNNNGVYEIKSDEQIQTELNLQYRRSHYPQISDQMGAIMKYLATKDDLPNELQDIVDKIDEVKIVYPKVVEKVS